jgi:diaminopimelate epimerase
VELEFYKYEGAGNDFILVDDRNNQFPDNKPDLVKSLCDRRFGIGADGLILLRPVLGYDFGMTYFNADGKEGSMCGNGGRCIASFARELGIIKDMARFIAIDGVHQAEMKPNGHVKLKMTDVTGIETGDGYYYLNTGSPHYVKFLPSVSKLDVVAEGRKIRYSKRFSREGTNVNFIEEADDHIFVRTYERGVENETLACGTGVVASVICTGIRQGINHQHFSSRVRVLGGELSVSFYCDDNVISNIWLEGPAAFVFKGSMQIS